MVRRWVSCLGTLRETLGRDPAGVKGLERGCLGPGPRIYGAR